MFTQLDTTQLFANKVIFDPCEKLMWDLFKDSTCQILNEYDEKESMRNIWNENQENRKLFLVKYFC